MIMSSIVSYAYSIVQKLRNSDKKKKPKKIPLSRPSHLVSANAIESGTEDSAATCVQRYDLYCVLVLTSQFKVTGSSRNMPKYTIPSTNH